MFSVGSQRSFSSPTGGVLGSPLRAAGSASWVSCFSKDFEGFQETVRFIMNHERHSCVYIVSTPGTTRNSKVFGGIPAQLLMPVLQAGNLDFPNAFQGFQEAVSFLIFGRDHFAHFAQNPLFSTVFAAFFLGSEGAFFLASCRGSRGSASTFHLI